MYFESGSAELTQSAQALIEKIKRLLASEPYMQAIIIGHSDAQPIGIALRQLYESNYDLALRRAEVVANLLKSNLKNVEVFVIGKGSSDSLAVNDRERSSSYDRRVDIVLGTDQEILKFIFGE